MVHKGLPVVHFARQEDWESWLEQNHAECPGLWLKIAKKGSGEASVTYEEALEAALCFGWIDGQKQAHDDHHWLQRFTPRRPGSRWSKINTQKVATLLEQGRVRTAGLEEVEAARDDGRWQSAYAGQRTMEVPEDLRLALEENPRARAFFAKLSSANRYAILYRVADARRPQTRARRIERYVAMLAEGQTLHPQ
jgi:uncharacterized protein YdeI (YjbR/CyaY-like superfamily)